MFRALRRRWPRILSWRCSKTLVFTWFWALQEGARGGTIGILRSFQHRWPKHGSRWLNMGQHRPNIGQHRANMVPRLLGRRPAVRRKPLNKGATPPAVDPIYRLGMAILSHLRPAAGMAPGVQLVVPNVAFWSNQGTSSKMIARVSKTDPLATLKHNGSEGRMAPAGLQLVVPNVGFWSEKKQWLPRLPQLTPSPQWNTMAVKDGWRLRPAAGRAERHFLKPQETSSKMIAHEPPPRWHTMAVKDGWLVPNFAFWNHKELLVAPKWLPRLPKRTPSPHWNTMAVKDGWRQQLWSCLMSLSETTRN